jgi:MoxR-like ATPase
MSTSLDKFLDTLEHLVNAHSQDATKNRPAIQWFNDTFAVEGRASVVNDKKQSYNRVKEQFSHQGAHVVFVLNDHSARSPLIQTSLQQWYPKLQSVLLLDRTGQRSYPTGALITKPGAAGPVVAFYQSSFHGLTPITLPATAAATPATPTISPLAVATAPKSPNWAVSVPANPCKLSEAEHPLRKALLALESGKNVIFVGAPGTGKTELAKCLAQMLGVDADVCTATSEWTTFETIGGYFPQPTGGGSVAGATQLDFAPGVVLRSIDQGRWLIIDELNRADVDKAFGELFTLLGGTNARLPFKKLDEGEFKEILIAHEGAPVDASAHVYVVPKSWRLIGTMNTFDKASLYQLSYAFMRRFAFIEIEAPSPPAFEKLIKDAIAVFRGKGSDAALDKVEDALIKLFAKDDGTSITAAGFRMGPAIALDSAKFAAVRASPTGGSITPHRAVQEALEGFVFPQFEGREKEHPRIVASIASILSLDAEGQNALSVKLSKWTGAALSN